MRKFIIKYYWPWVFWVIVILFAGGFFGSISANSKTLLLIGLVAIIGGYLIDGVYRKHIEEERKKKFDAEIDRISSLSDSDLSEEYFQHVMGGDSARKDWFKRAAYLNHHHEIATEMAKRFFFEHTAREKKS